jgi:hypothetical protein
MLDMNESMVLLSVGLLSNDVKSDVGEVLQIDCEVSTELEVCLSILTSPATTKEIDLSFKLELG